MIQPEDIARKAEAIYREYLGAWLDGARAFFPRVVPARRDPGDDVAVAIDRVRRLREGSKEVLGYGYTVEWKEVRSRRHGRNLFPQRILFATEQDLLRLVKKERDFGRFAAAVTRLRAELPELDPWLRSNVRALTEAADDLEGLLEVVRWLRGNPRPRIFAREMPLGVDTKFVERNERILRPWLDRVLPASAIRADEEHFERRFGLRYREPDVFVRVLDPALQSELGFPCPALSLPLHTLGDLRVTGANTIVVENRVNLLTLPLLARTIAIGGLGNGASLLRHVTWLETAPLRYWGDLDVEGLAILSRVRALYPASESIFMDRATLERYRSLVVRGNDCDAASATPPGLTAGESDAFTACRTENLRLEQERIPHRDVLAALTPG